MTRLSTPTAAPQGSQGHSPDASSSFVAHDRLFKSVVGARPRLELVVHTAAHEGPVYTASEDALFFTTVPPPDAPRERVGAVGIDRLALDGERFPLETERVTTLRSGTANANGMTLGLDGRLIACEQGSADTPARVSYVDPATGALETAIDAWRGFPFNSPNDVVAKRDGTIWFTDPSYGWLQGFRPPPQVGDYVYRYDPVTGHVAPVADGFSKPNGLAFSPDEQVLYVTDSGANQEEGSYYPHLPHHVIAFDVMNGRHLGAPRLVAVVAPGFPDGVKTDDMGRVYTSCASGVLVLTPSGDLIGELILPGAVNFTFGGPDRNVLYITTDDAVWAAVLETTGGVRAPSIPQGA